MHNFQESHTHVQAIDGLLMPGVYDGLELKSWQSDFEVQLLDAQAVLMKVLESM